MMMFEGLISESAVGRKAFKKEGVLPQQVTVHHHGLFVG